MEELMETLLAGFFSSKILWSSCFGSAGGAAIIVIIDRVIKHKENKMNEFKTAISIQLSLNLMLSDLLAHKLLNEQYEHENKEYYRSVRKDPDTTWQNFRHIDLKRIDRTFDLVDQDWNFSQFLSKKKTDHQRTILGDLIRAKACYQHLTNLSNHRNKRINKMLNIIESFKNKEGIDDIYLYENNNAKKIIGEKLFEELKSITDDFFKDFNPAVQQIHNTFNNLSEYIKKSFYGYSPLGLTLYKSYQKELDEINKKSQES